MSEGNGRRGGTRTRTRKDRQGTAGRTVPYLPRSRFLPNARTSISTIFSCGQKGSRRWSAISIILDVRQPIAGRMRLRNSLRESFRAMFRDDGSSRFGTADTPREIAHLGVLKKYLGMALNTRGLLQNEQSEQSYNTLYKGICLRLYGGIVATRRCNATLCLMIMA